MTNSKIEKMNAYFDEQIAACQGRSLALLADERQDEADFEKIKANVYDIFRTMLSVGCNTQSTPEAAASFLEKKLEMVPANWCASLARAQEHGDAGKAHIERLKLDAVEDIKTNFKLIWEDNND